MPPVLRSPTLSTVQNLVAVIGLTVAGVAAIVGGIITWRTAKKLVADAQQTLRQMFGDSFPGLFAHEEADEQADPKGARIAAVGFAAVGVALLVTALVLAVVPPLS